MKITFVNPPFKTEYGKFSRESRSPCIGHSGVLYYPLWLIYAAAVCEKAGYEVDFIDACAERLNREETLQKLESLGESALFVFDTSTPSIYSDIEFAGAVKDMFPRAFTLLVGTHPSATADETMGVDSRIDGIARREYDYIVRDLAAALNGGDDLSTVRGLTYQRDGEVVHNPDAEPITDLDDIPFAAEFIHRRLNPRDYVFAAAAYPSVQIFTGRGCPARCNFCVYPQTMHGHAYRLRSPENVVAEFEFVVNNMKGVKEIVIEDDTFTANKARTVAICQMIIDRGLNKKIRWLCNARVNLDLETMKLMKKAGCHLIIPGIESISQEILNNIKKGTTVKQIEEYVANAKKAGLMIHACYMVGNKGETRETMEATLAAALSFKTDTAQFFPLIPYPGTEAYNWAKENGYISGRYDEYCKEDGTLNCVLSLPGLTPEELVKFCAMARRKYYVRPWYIWHRIWMGLRDPEDLKRSLKAFKKLAGSLMRGE
ncbi:MAG: radical SAM protein [Clostridia bacterium]|nr:radical SAM protein [Clostridia bacterium]